jgi:general secretion pathway protein L
MTRRPSIKLNLLPEDLRIRQTRWAYVPAVILGLAVLALLAALAFHRTFQNRALVRKLDQEIQALKGPVDRVQSVRGQTEALEGRIRAFEDRLRNKDMNLEILRELTNILPSDTYLTTYTYRDGTIQMGGSSASAPKLIAELEKSPLLKDVTQKGGIFKEPQTGKDRFSFEAKLEK